MNSLSIVAWVNGTFYQCTNDGKLRPVIRSKKKDSYRIGKTKRDIANRLKRRMK